MSRVFLSEMLLRSGEHITASDSYSLMAIPGGVSGFDGKTTQTWQWREISRVEFK